MPAVVVMREVVMEATRLKRRLIARRWRNRFHVKIWEVGEAGDEDAVEGLRFGIEEDVLVVGDTTDDSARRGVGHTLDGPR